MCDKNNSVPKNDNDKIPLECPPRENKTIVEPVEDIREKIEF